MNCHLLISLKTYHNRNSVCFVWISKSLSLALIWSLQESIIKQINEDPTAGWQADMNPRFSNYTVSLQLPWTVFKIILKIIFFPLIFYLLDTFNFVLFYNLSIALTSSYVQVGQFKHLLGVKPTPEKDLKGTPLITHPKSLKLPSNFDARTAWPQCTSIGRILG